MNKSYLIQWKSRINGRSGRGTNLFELEMAERLAEELNREYPAIHHEVAEANSPSPGLDVPLKQDQTGEVESEKPQIHDSPDLLAV